MSENLRFRMMRLLAALPSCMYLVAGRNPAPHTDTPPSAWRQSNPNAAADAVEKLYGLRDHPDLP